MFLTKILSFLYYTTVLYLINRPCFSYIYVINMLFLLQSGILFFINKYIYYNLIEKIFALLPIDY